MGTRQVVLILREAYKEIKGQYREALGEEKDQVRESQSLLTLPPLPTSFWWAVQKH